MGKVLVAIPAYNEAGKIGRVIQTCRYPPGYEVVVVDDGSTDATVADIRSAQAHVETPVTVRAHTARQGVGACFQEAFRYALAHAFEFVAFLAGNTKDDPKDVVRLVNVLSEGGYDYVQGARHLPGGGCENTPWLRVIGTRWIHPALFWCVTGRWMHDTTNGLRVFRATLLTDPRIRWDQAWLRGYELEPYLLYYAVRLGYRVGEVAVKKTYPPKALGITKMPALTGWWLMSRALVYLGLRLKR